MIAASGDELGAAIFMSVFFIKIGLVSVSPEQNVRHPVRGSAHLFTDSFEISSGITFDDQFIMNMTDDEAVPKSLHSIAEDIATYGLNDIFYEFRSVGFNAFPLLCGADAFISDGFTAEMIGSDPGLNICEPASGRKLDEEHTAFVKELNTPDFGFDPLGNSGFDSAVNVPPECGDHRIGITPGVYMWL